MRDLRDIYQNQLVPMVVEQTIVASAPTISTRGF